jgi:hypothetical protein
MKSLSIIFLLFLQFCSSSKKAEQEIFPKRNEIIGKWQLFETCISPGAACELKKIENGVIIEFKADGTFLVSNKSDNEGIYQCDGKFKLVEIETNPAIRAIEFSPSCNKALWTLYYSFNDDNSLNINPQCIEECRYTYKPI